MVTTFYPPYHFGGDAVHVYRLSEALAEAGHSVHVIHSLDAFHLQHPGPPPFEFRHHPRVRTHGLRSRSAFWWGLLAHQSGGPALYRRALLDVLQANEFDVIHFHNVSLVGGPGVLGLGRGVKLYTANEYWLICPTHVLFAFDREACTERRCLACTLRYRRPPQLWRYTGAVAKALRHVDCLLMPSRFALEQHRAQGIDRPMLHLPYFVPLPGPEQAAAARPAAPYFLYAGRLEKLKGVQDLIPLFEDYREAELWIAGAGGYEPELRALAARAPRVRFLGRVHPDQLGALYRGAIAALVPSLCYETFGLTAAEAMSYGTPAIVRRIGALAENIEQSGGGLSFATQAECREAMEALRTNPALRDRLGRQGREAVERLWSARAYLDRYLGHVEALLERRAADGAARLDAR